MNKFFIVLALLLAVFCCVSCGNTDTDSTNTGAPVQTESSEAKETAKKTSCETTVSVSSDWVEANKVTLESTPEFEQGDMKVYSPEDALEALDYTTTFTPTYRDTYYQVPEFLFDIAEESLAEQWEREVYQPSVESNVEPEECYIVSFVKFCQISKEDFVTSYKPVKANILSRSIKGEDMTSEEYEILDADLLYTFDNDIINDYFRRDKATSYAEVAE